MNESWHIVDLPGYGYAKVAKSERSRYLQSIYQYLLKRKSLACLFLLIDSRHKPLVNDLVFLRWLGTNEIPFVICFTKIDKLSSAQLNKSVNEYRQVLLREWEFLPRFFYASVTHHQGRDEILAFIEETNNKILKKK